MDLIFRSGSQKTNDGCSLQNAASVLSVSWCGTRHAASGSEGAFVARHATHARNASGDFLLSASAHISSPDSKPDVRNAACSLPVAISLSCFR